MTVVNPYSKFGYLAIGKESSPGAVVAATIFLELLSEDIVVNYNRQPVQPIAGRIDTVTRSVKDKITVTGTVTVTIDPKNIGYFLTNFFGLPTTVTIQAGKVFEHKFTPQAEPPTYTFDVKPADDTYVQRYIGVRITNLEISQTDNKMQAVITISAQKAFTQSRITTATDSATQQHVDQSTGLIAGTDVLEFRDRADATVVNGTASLSSITSETVIVVGTAQTVSAKDIVTIRKSSALYTLSKDLVWIGCGKYGDGDDIDNIANNDTEDATFTFTREAEERHTAAGNEFKDRFPSKILLKGLGVTGQFQHHYQSPKFLEAMRQGEKRALRSELFGVAIDTNSAQAANLLFGSGATGVRCTASVASETSNNLNVTVINNNVDALAASKSGNNILVKKADTDTTKNTATLVAAAVNALSGVTAAADGSGTEEVARLVKTNFGSGSNLRGRDANEKEKLQIDLPDTRFTPFNANDSEENIVQEEIDFTAQYDTISGYTTRVTLRNDISSYA